MKNIGFTKVSLPYGWLGNMSPYKIYFQGKEWRTTEALFQAMRFKDVEIKEAIQLEKSPMGAKFKAKKHKDKMVIDPMGSIDKLNMEICVALKLKQHPNLKEMLIKTGSSLIYEDVSTRKNRGSSLFWGAVLNKDGSLDGENVLGKIWMNERDKL
jgi:ribA/ribD-fused uncharacterized protein